MLKCSMCIVIVAASVLTAGAKLVADDDDDVKLKFSEAPAAVQKTFKREASGAKIETVKKQDEDDKTIYSAEVTIDGKNYEIQVAEDGTLQKKTLKEDDAVEVEFSACPK